MLCIEYVNLSGQGDDMDVCKDHASAFEASGLDI